MRQDYLADRGVNELRDKFVCRVDRVEAKIEVEAVVKLKHGRTAKYRTVMHPQP